VYAADGLLPEAWRRCASTMKRWPAKGGDAGEYADRHQSACDLADQVLSGALSGARLPVRQVNRAGVTRQLVSYKRDVPVEKGIFDLPKDLQADHTGGTAQIACSASVALHFLGT